ncbi:MAG: hypothetical protein ACREXV_12310 [Polaromonas sp.]
MNKNRTSKPHGGPRHDVAPGRAKAKRSAGSRCNSHQRAALQCGQRSISIAAMRRMKAWASSILL